MNEIQCVDGIGSYSKFSVEQMIQDAFYTEVTPMPVVIYTGRKGMKVLDLMLKYWWLKENVVNREIYNTNKQFRKVINKLYSNGRMGRKIPKAFRGNYS